MRTLVRGLWAALVVAAPAVAQTPPAAVEPAEYAIELRVLTASGKDGRAELMKLFDPKAADPKAAVLTDADRTALLEKVTRDVRTTVTQAPRVTVRSGEPASVTVQDTTTFVTAVTVSTLNGKTVVVPKTEKVPLGQAFRVAASAGEKGVRLELKYEDKRVAPHVRLLPVTTFVVPEFEGGSQGAPVPFTQFVQVPEFRDLKCEKVADVPDGGTLAVYAGKTKVEARVESGPPVLSRIPYVNRLFKNTGIGEQECDVVILATPMRVAGYAAVRVSGYGLNGVSRFTPYQAVYLAKPGEVTRATAPADDLADLLTAYRAACASGDKEAAKRLAAEALAKDPTCFGRTN